MPSSSVFVCFVMKNGAALQEGFDFWNLFLEDGEFIDGVDYASIDTGTATLSVTLESGRTRDEWIAGLPPAITEAPVLESISADDAPCR